MANADAQHVRQQPQQLRRRGAPASGRPAELRSQLERRRLPLPQGLAVKVERALHKLRGPQPTDIVPLDARDRDIHVPLHTLASGQAHQRRRQAQVQLPRGDLDPHRQHQVDDLRPEPLAVLAAENSLGKEDWRGGADRVQPVVPGQEDHRGGGDLPQERHPCDQEGGASEPSTATSSTSADHSPRKKDRGSRLALHQEEAGQVRNTEEICRGARCLAVSCVYYCDAQNHHFHSSFSQLFLYF